MKYFRMSYDEVVFKRSYLNLILLNRSIPGFKPIDTKEEEKKKESENIEDMTIESEFNEHASDFFMNFM